MKFETQCIRTQTKRSIHREHSSPIFPTSSFVFENAEQMRAMFAGEIDGNIYSRFSNPNCSEFENKMALLEGGESALSTATGMAAISSVIFGLLKSGDHLLASNALFGSTFQILKNFLPKFNIEYSFVDPDQIGTWEDQIKPNTKMLLLETPSNPGLKVIDLESTSSFAKKHNILLAVDNCFATPYLQRPLDYGADIIMHSATKYIDGQGRVLGGCIVSSNEIIDEIRPFFRNTGPSLSPFNAWILSKSLETLPVRMDRHCSNALALAHMLLDHPEIEVVNYPFLPDNDYYDIAKKQMKAGGGMLTFELKGGINRGIKFIDAVQMLSISANLGDTRTIITHPASSTHSKLSPEERMVSGINDGLVRLSVGLEHPDDIYEDLIQAIKKT